MPAQILSFARLPSLEAQEPALARELVPTQKQVSARELVSAQELALARESVQLRAVVLAVVRLLSVEAQAPAPGPAQQLP